MQLFGGVITLVLVPLLVVLFACIHRVTGEERKILSELALLFTVLFAAMVSINRFVQLAVVKPSMLSGNTEGLARFLPYDPGSAMFALEILGWGFFLGLAALFVAPVFARGRVEKGIRWLFVAYGVLGLTSALGLVLSSPISAVGFVAWGLILYVATALLIVYFRRAERTGPARRDD